LVHGDSNNCCYGNRGVEHCVGDFDILVQNCSWSTYSWESGRTNATDPEILQKTVVAGYQGDNHVIVCRATCPEPDCDYFTGKLCSHEDSNNCCYGNRGVEHCVGDYGVLLW
jgi:hypothetical protein